VHAKPDHRIIAAESAGDLRHAADLFREYAASLGVDLSFQAFEREVSSLPGAYAPPSGRLLLLFSASSIEPAGCVALRELDDSICEMKRLYLRPQFRGKGLGRALADRTIAEARHIGYRRMRLDTVEPVMKDAVAMYRKLGFQEIAPYCPNPMAGVVYMELQL
jgi:GNAT superfamily N-acetyltransferase